LEAVRLSAEHFLKSTSWEDDIEGVLGRLGIAARVGRVYVFENYVGQDGNLWATQRYEWTAPGVSPQIGNPLMRALPYRAQGWGRWQEVLSRGETLYGHTREFPEEERPELEAQHIKSIVLVPVFVDGAWWGFIGFDECDRERRWSAAEIGALQHSASTLGAAIQRERTEAALKEREEQYRRIFEESSDGLVIRDMQGNIVEANRALCEMHGYTREEFLALPPLANIHPDYRHLMPEYIRMVEEGGEYRIRSVDLRKDGTTFHVEVHGTRFTYMGKPHVLGEVRDITERVEAYRLLEERVEERTRELATLLEVSGEVASTLELRRLLGLILQRVKGVIDYDAAAISLLDDQDQLNLFLYEGPIPDSDLRSVPPLAQARGRKTKQTGGSRLRS
jgi:PAS domain S-box-containing protein